MKVTEKLKSESEMTGSLIVSTGALPAEFGLLGCP
jgi:hypothetical protein